MKGNKQVVDALQKRFSEQHSAIMQYMTQAEIAGNWGYEGLAKELRGIAIQEMKHAEQHIERIVFLEYIPDVIKIAPVKIGQNIADFLAYGKEAEAQAVILYAETIKLAREVGDVGTAEYVEHILKEEEAHLNYFEAQLSQINQMGVNSYLVSKVEA